MHAKYGRLSNGHKLDSIMKFHTQAKIVQPDIDNFIWFFYLDMIFWSSVLAKVVKSTEKWQTNNSVYGLQVDMSGVGYHQMNMTNKQRRYFIACLYVMQDISGNWNAFKTFRHTTE